MNICLAWEKHFVPIIMETLSLFTLEGIILMAVPTNLQILFILLEWETILKLLVRSSVVKSSYAIKKSIFCNIASLILSSYNQLSLFVVFSSNSSESQH